MPQRRQETRRFLATVLFTDIVGSTQHAATKICLFVWTSLPLGCEPLAPVDGKQFPFPWNALELVLAPLLEAHI